MKDAMITPEEFTLAMKKLGVNEACPKIAVAVSGGGDSLALAALMHEWVKARGGEVLALTVDHGLRSESADEALKVQKLLNNLGIAHEILTWEGDKPETHVQELARDARYNLLLQTCRKIGFPVLAVAHNLEDQIETFWMRLAHGSGLDGLSAMAAARDADGLCLIRPVLQFPRVRLRATCLHHRMEWIEDPSNRNEKYLRVRLRQFENLLAEEGLNPSRLAMTVQKLEDAREALQVMTSQAVDACVVLHPEGYAAMKMQGWLKCPRDIQRRILWRVLTMVAMQQYPAGFETMEQTRLDLHKQSFAGKNLAGCEIFPGQPGEMLVVREANAVEGRVPVDAGGMWDGRFSVSGFYGESIKVGALGESGLSKLRKNIANSGTSARKLKGLHLKVKRVLPALWHGDNLLAVPHVGYYSQACPCSMQTGQILFVKIG